ncbi:MAG: T9SS type A sorting domain-containing protein, partial [Bacteroidia bacterium]|nr:T9SS type A sorting domain-containing protein [Bacteroidia bacterium]
LKFFLLKNKFHYSKQPTMKRVIIFLMCFCTTQKLLSQATWTQKSNYGGGAIGYGAGFSIGNNGYITTGDNQNTELWEWNQTSNQWSQKASFPGGPRVTAIAFSIGTKGYVGTGYNAGMYFQDFWEYDPSNNLWTQKASLPGPARCEAVGFSIGNKGYIATGKNGLSSFQDLWEYDPVNDTWTQKLDFPGTARYGAVGFSILSKGYVGTGYDGIDQTDFWEYDPASNSWNQKNSFGGSARDLATGFSVGNMGYLGAGAHIGVNYQDFWEFNPLQNTWTQITLFPGLARNGAVGFSIGGYGYLGTGWDSPNLLQDFWELGPDTLMINRPEANFISSDSVFCNSTCIDFMDLSSNNPLTWSWSFSGGSPPTSTDQNPTNICFSTPGQFDVTLIVTNTYGTDTIEKPNFIRIAVPQVPIITRSFDTLQCSSAYSYQWLFYGDSIQGATDQNLITMIDGLYSVITVDSNGCEATSAVFDFSTQIKELTQDFSITPNPVSNVLQISSNTKNVTLVSFRIVSAFGIVSKTGFLENSQIDVSDLSSGVYYLLIMTKKNNTSLKFIKQ